MKVLVADKISPKGVAYLRQQPGIEVVEAYGSSPEKVLELVKDVHAIAVRSETKITAEVFKAQAGLFIVHIPYRGTALAIPDLVSGKLDVMFDSLPTGLPHVRDGRLKALAVTSAKRSPLAPDLPAVAEAVPGFESNTWFGLYGPKGLPNDIRDKVSAVVQQVLQDADIKDRLARLGIEPVGGNATQFAQMVQADSAKWKKIIAERKITID